MVSTRLRSRAFAGEFANESRCRARGERETKANTEKKLVPRDWNGKQAALRVSGQKTWRVIGRSPWAGMCDTDRE